MKLEVEALMKVAPVEKRFVEVALVVVLLVTVNPPMVAKVATKLEMKELVEVLLVAVKLVKNPVVAVRRVAKRLDEEALVFWRLVMVALAEVRSVIVPLVMVVVASVLVPTTRSVPLVRRFPCGSA